MCILQQPGGALTPLLMLNIANETGPHDCRFGCRGGFSGSRCCTSVVLLGSKVQRSPSGSDHFSDHSSP